MEQRKAITMQITNFKEMYIAELQELLSVEQQLSEALTRMAEAVSHPSLKDAFRRHQRQTLTQADRLRSILKKHKADGEAHTDQALQAMIKEAGKMIEMLNGYDLRDAGLLASAQKLEHYEIAAYGSVAALAGQLELRDSPLHFVDLCRHAFQFHRQPAGGFVHQVARLIRKKAVSDV